MKKNFLSQLFSKIYQRFFAVKNSQPAYDEVIRTTPEQAKLRIPAPIQKRVYELLNMKEEQQPGQPISVHLMLNHTDSTVNLQTARWLAAQQHRDLYRVDLSGLVSTYIGETEKNLDRIFYKATNNNLILLFDEADALFGKKSDVKDAHDRYANLEIAYLQKSIRSFAGTVLFNCSTDYCRNWQPSDFVKIADEAVRLNSSGE